MEGVSVNAPVEGEPGQKNGVPSPANESIAHWARFLDECVRQRLETEKPLLGVEDDVCGDN